MTITAQWASACQ